jgi:hypothetical protein
VTDEVLVVVCGTELEHVNSLGASRAFLGYPHLSTIVEEVEPALFKRVETTVPLCVELDALSGNVELVTFSPPSKVKFPVGAKIVS